MFFLLYYINDLGTHVPLFKYVDDSTLFEILCNMNEISEIQESIAKAADCKTESIQGCHDQSHHCETPRKGADIASIHTVAG